MSELECRDFSKAFGAVVALKGVGFSVKSGDIRALFGGNGSGKSTCAKILGGSVFKNDGEIYIDGKKIEIDSPISAIKQGIAVTSQELSLFPKQTVNQNLILLDTPKKFLFFQDRAAARSKALSALERVGLPTLLDTLVSQLTDSQMYLVEFAKALILKPRILVVDEITSSLGHQEVAIVAKILKEMAAEGCIILYISHRVIEIFDICSSVTVLRNGEVVNTYQTSRVTEQMLLTDMIGSKLPVLEQHESGKQAGKKSGDCRTALSAKGLRIRGFSGDTIDLELKAGEILGVAGLQGQGKARLVKRLFGLSEPLEMELSGKKKRIIDPITAISNGIGYLTGDRVNEGVFYGRSIGENLNLVNNVVLKYEPLKIDDVLQKNKVKYKSSALPIETLSGGNQQKVVLLRWTSLRPNILLADDPTKGIDIASKLDVYEIFRQMARQGSAIVFVSSDEEELVSMGRNTDHYSVAVMYDGKIVKRLYGSDITTANIISASIPTG
ncbi:MAG: sugar ABC transporter ATP-binding protein [Deltaproteobacteria bacterium]|nr:sugar ABC transporter ATP-binding protein [Deltaproteobacteria bacterium]